MLKLLGDASENALATWRDQAPPAEAQVVYEALFAISDGTWVQLYDHWTNRAYPACTVMALTAEVQLVWHVPLELPGCFRVVAVLRT